MQESQEVGSTGTFTSALALHPGLMLNMRCVSPPHVLKDIVSMVNVQKLPKASVSKSGTQVMVVHSGCTSIPILTHRRNTQKLCTMF